MEVLMPKALEFLKLTRLAKPLTWAEGLRILQRDRFCCRYCGLDGAASFENSLIMSVDFIIPRARKGSKDPDNLVAACRPCNVIKGKRVFKDFDEAKGYVLTRRQELREQWKRRTARFGTLARA
jgi:5-methylcytosine-specific restriction endonuclease McrA